MKRRLRNLQHHYAPYLFLLPFLLLFAFFFAGPLARSLMLSFYRSAGPRHATFIGIENYRFLIIHDKLFWLAVANTTGFAIAYLCLQIPISLGLALLLNRQGVRFRNGLRFAFFSTSLVGQVFVAVIFFQLFDPRRGLINRTISLLLHRPVQIDWLTHPDLIMVSVLIAALWLSIGFGMVFFLAALQSVDRELYEAVSVDGAGRWSTFWHVTLPGIRHVIALLIVIGTINAFQLFELPFVLLQNSGSVNYRGLTIVTYLFITGFEAGDLGYAAAIGWILAALLFVIAIAQARLMHWTED
jgi:ABC-type sugar transport system permease subunit